MLNSCSMTQHYNKRTCQLGLSDERPDAECQTGELWIPNFKFFWY